MRSTYVQIHKEKIQVYSTKKKHFLSYYKEKPKASPSQREELVLFYIRSLAQLQTLNTNKGSLSLYKEKH